MLGFMQLVPGPMSLSYLSILGCKLCVLPISGKSGGSPGCLYTPIFLPQILLPLFTSNTPVPLKKNGTKNMVVTEVNFLSL